MRSSTWVAILGLVLVLVGIVGIAWLMTQTPVVVPRADWGVAPDTLPRFGPRAGPRGGIPGTILPPAGDTTLSLGARIYLYGVGEGGNIPRSAIGPGMMGGGCAMCHGVDGKGGTFSMMMGRFQAPDIRYDTLTSRHEEDGEAHEPWTDREIRRSIVEGVEPDGKRLDIFMPRWQMTASELDAVLVYLKELSSR